MRENDPTIEELELQRKHKFKKRPKISIVIPLYNTPEDLFRELSKYYEELESAKTGSLDDVINMVNSDINSFSKAMEVFSKYDDRGAKRVVNWASKSTNIMKVIIDTYKEKGIDYIKNTKIWVCDICGFIYVGDNPPKVCPVCRVPSVKILEVC